MVGWLNASLAFEGLLAAGPEFDRDTVTAATNAMTDFDAGGLLEPIDWTEAHTPTRRTPGRGQQDECSTLVKVEDGEFITVAPPDKPWLCWSQTDLAWSEPEPTSVRLTRGAPTVIVAASIGRTCSAACCRACRPGTVYGLIALGFVLAYKTSGVFNLAFGAQAYMSAAMYFEARASGAGASCRRFVLSVLILAPASAWSSSG